jgi:RNA polymerase sigma-70 factor (ECF subfamily)
LGLGSAGPASSEVVCGNIRAVNADAREELRRVYRLHVRHVFSFFSYSASSAVAEDLTSQTFERVIASWDRYDASRASERTWILAIARNILIDHHRRERHRDAVSLDEHPALLDSFTVRTDLHSEALGIADFADWLQALGEREREVLALRFAADLSPSSIASLLELSTANVHQIISRSLRRLRREQSSQEEDDAPPD